MARPYSAVRLQAALIWGLFLVALVVALVAAASSPLLAWRRPVYIAAGFAGILGLGLLLFQPLLAAGVTPGLSPARARRLHRWAGGALVVAVALHVAGLWITSPPDMVDALLFRAPTIFSLFGVVAMWAVLAAAALALTRHRLGLAPGPWRRAHSLFAALIVTATVVHALLIEGTMETVSKTALCLFAALALAGSLRALAGRRRARPTRP